RRMKAGVRPHTGSDPGRFCGVGPYRVRPRLWGAGSDPIGSDPNLLSSSAQAFALVAAVLHAAAPFHVVQVPLDGFAQAGFEAFLRHPAKFALDLAGVDGVAQVVAGAVFDV